MRDISFPIVSIVQGRIEMKSDLKPPLQTSLKIGDFPEDNDISPHSTLLSSLRESMEMIMTRFLTPQYSAHLNHESDAIIIPEPTSLYVLSSTLFQREDLYLVTTCAFFQLFLNLVSHGKEQKYG